MRDVAISTPAILGVFSHPDDESWVIAGVTAKYAAVGVPTTVLSLTRGERGKVKRPDISIPSGLGKAREDEFRDACRRMNAVQAICCDFGDGQADRWDTNAIVDMIVKTIRTVRPTTVITWEPGGDTGHPDHILTSKLTVEAVNLSGSGAFAHHFECGLHPYTPGRVYYTAGLPITMASHWLGEMKRRGVSEEDLGVVQKLLTDSDDVATTLVDISAFVPQKLECLNAHKTQMPIGGPFARWPADLVLPLLRYECFTRVPRPLLSELKYETEIV